MTSWKGTYPPNMVNSVVGANKDNSLQFALEWFIQLSANVYPRWCL